MTKTKNLSRLRGDNYPYNLTFRDDTGTPIDITGWKITFTLRELYSIQEITPETNDSTAIFTVDATITDAINGVAVINFAINDFNIDPESYSYDIQIINNGIITTLVYGTLTILADTTRVQS